MTDAPTDVLTIPAAAEAGRRPLRCRTLQDPARAPRRAGGDRHLPDGHLPPAGAGPRPGRPGARGPGRAVLAARGARGGARQRRRHGVLGRRHRRPGPREEPAPVLRGVLLEVRQGRRAGAVARRPVGDQGRPGLAPGTGRRAGRGRLRLGPQRDLHRRDGARAPSGRDRRRCPRARRRDVGRRRPARRPDRGGRLLLRAAEELRLRRRAVDRDHVAGRPRPRRRDRRLGPAHPGVLRPAHGDRQLAQEPDLQHPVAGHLVPDGRAAGLDERPRRPARHGRAHHRVLRRALRLGRQDRLHHAVRRRPRRTARW